MLRQSLTPQSNLTFDADTPRLPSAGELVFWLLPPMQNARAVIGKLLEVQLGRIVHWRIGEFGKPELACGTVSISYSHTRALTLVALRKFGAIGVDIEGPRTLSPELLKRCYTAPERALCAVQPDAARQIWCMKEAYVKAIGRGIAFGLQHIDCSGPPIKLIESKHAPNNFELPAFTGSYRLTENHVAGLVCLVEAPQAFIAIDLRQYCLQLGINAQ
jgi:phosphopantetheinyl transferase